jgi:hypothetical protein
MLAYKCVSDFSVIGVDIIYIFNSEMCNMNNSKPIGGGDVPMIFLKKTCGSLFKKTVLLHFAAVQGKRRIISNFTTLQVYLQYLNLFWCGVLP